MKLVLIGIQGAGKSTQGNLLSEKYNIPYVHEIALLAGLHKARLHIDFITEEEKEQSRQWLKERGFKEKLF